MADIETNLDILLTKRNTAIPLENGGHILLQNQDEYMAGLKKASVTEVFNGQSYIILFPDVEDYSTATVASIVASGIDLGQILEGSTEWTGEDASFDNRIDERGNVIVANPTAGTYGFNFFMSDFSAEKLTTFMHGKTVALTGMDSTVFSTTTQAIAVGDQIPVITRPIALVNDEANKAIFFPKARIITSPGIDSKLAGLQASVVAEDCNVEGKLGTMMYIPKTSLKFDTAA